jgi:hypothetical protein
MDDEVVVVPVMALPHEGSTLQRLSSALFREQTKQTCRGDDTVEHSEDQGLNFITGSAGHSSGRDG